MNSALYREESNVNSLIIALLLPPFLMSSPFCFVSIWEGSINYIVSAITFFICLIIYSSFAIPTYRYAIRNNIKSFSFFTLIGTLGGTVAGVILLYIFGGFYKGDEIDVNVLPFFGGFIGLIAGFSFSYFFWANTVKQGVRSIIFSLLILVFFIFLPSLYISLDIN